MPYTDLTVDDGRNFLPKIWNIFFKPGDEHDFFVEPWMNHELRDCAEFRALDGTGAFHVVVADPAVLAFLRETAGEIYLYGAYNQINVCQMRARGTVEVSTEPVPREMQRRLWAGIRSRVGSTVNKLDEKEAAERWRMLRTGTLVRFHVAGYAYQSYERG